MKNHLIGYVRVSTPKQSMDIQILQLKQYAESKGCTIEIYSEKHSGREYKKYDREALTNALAKAKETESPIVVTYLDRLSRNIGDGMEIWDNYKVIPVLEIVPNRDSAFASFKKAEDEMMKISIKSKLALDAMRGFTPDFFYNEYTDYCYVWYYANVNSFRFQKLPDFIQGIIAMDAIINCDYRTIDKHIGQTPREICDEAIRCIKEELVFDKEYIEQVWNRYRNKTDNIGYDLPKMFKATIKKAKRLQDAIWKGEEAKHKA